MPQNSAPSLWGLLADDGDLLASRFLADEDTRVRLATLRQHTTLDVDPAELSERSILIRSNRQLTAALALIELDGIARRVIICPPDLAPGYLTGVVDAAAVDAVVAEVPGDEIGPPRHYVTCRPNIFAPCHRQKRGRETEWILFTSGTTGAPKMVVHTLATLVGPLARVRALGKEAVWGTFYDIRRYGGLQVLLRALVAHGSMVFSDGHGDPAAFLARAAAAGVSYISGTPSHWRRTLMSPGGQGFSPAYVRLSGEVADQAILDKLKARFPQAKVAHAFASTEAGLAFEVEDGLAGFPAHFVGDVRRPAELRVKDGSLHVRSGRTALRYLGDDAKALADAEGFVDTGDLLELRRDRYHFAGRREGVINVGGLKVNPEQVEAVINQHPQVAMSVVHGRRNPITGALVVADIVVKASTADDRSANASTKKTIDEVIALCRQNLEQHKVPTSIRVVPSIEIAASGKVGRIHA